MKSIKILLSLAVIAGIMMTSCKKDEEPEATPMKKATITGFVYADLDLTEAGMEYAPAGTKISAWIDTEELFLNPDPAVTYPRKYYETTVGGDGKFTLSIEVGNNPVTVNIEPGDFWYQQEVAVDTYETKMYSMGGVTITAFQGQTKIIDIAFF
jgi:hypothetical protein